MRAVLAYEAEKQLADHRLRLATFYGRIEANALVAGEQDRAARSSKAISRLRSLDGRNRLVASRHDPDDDRRGIGVKTLASFKKFSRRSPRSANT